MNFTNSASGSSLPWVLIKKTHQIPKHI